MINWFQKKCDKIIQRKLESVEEENEILILTDQISFCEELLDKIQDFEQDLQKLIHKGIIINLVSILESFFKLYFNKMIKEWEFSSETLAYTIDKKIKISDLVHFQSRDIHISELLAEFLNFQDLSDIDKIFRALLELNKSIYELMLDFYNRNLGSKTKKLKSIYPKLQEIIELRHNIVHNIFFELNLTRNEILDYITFIRTIILSLAELISEKLLEINNERGIMTLGFLKWGFYNYKEAIECFKKCIEINPEFWGYWFSLSMIYKEWGKFNKSIKIIKTYLEKKPEVYDGWYYFGEILLEDKKYKESIKAFQKALDLKPNDIECLNSIILNYLYLDESEKALKVVKSVLEIGNQNLNTYWLSGALYFNLNDFSKALESYNKCLKGDPNDVCYLCMKGRTLSNLHKFEDAITLFEKILTIDPKEVCYFKYYGEIYYNKGDIKKTISILKDGMKLAQEGDNQDEIIKIQEILDELKAFGKIDT